jgi:hypothetical protein
MPTTIPLLSRDADAELQRGDRAHERNTDRFATVVFSVIGVGLTIGLAAPFPLVANALAIF